MGGQSSLTPPAARAKERRHRLLWVEATPPFKHTTRPELTCVWMSSPVTMLPTALRAGEATL